MKILVSFLACFFCIFSTRAENIIDYELTTDNLPYTENFAPEKSYLSEHAMDFSSSVVVNSDVIGYQIHPATVYDAKRQIWHTAWWNRSSNKKVNQIYYAYSYDEGQTWSINERVDKSPLGAEYPCMVLNKKGRPVIAWADYRKGGRDIYASKRNDEGWTKPIRINDGLFHTAYKPSMTFYKGLFVAVWTDERDGLPNIYTSTSTDGKHWTTNIRANDGLGYGPVTSNPRIIAGKNGTIYLVFNGWEGQAYGGGRFPDIYFTKSTDYGQSWMSPQVRVNIQTDYYQQDPDITVDAKGNLYVVWEDNWEDFFTIRIYFAKSEDGGMSWTNKVIDDGPVYSVRMHPKIISNGKDLDVAWGVDNRNRNNYQRVFFTLSKNYGETWSNDQLVNDNPRSNINDALSLSGNGQGAIYCLWHEFLKNSGQEFYNILSAKGTKK